MSDGRRRSRGSDLELAAPAGIIALPETVQKETAVSEAVITADRKAALADDLARLRALVEASRVEEARSLIKQLEIQWPESEEVQHFARVLAPPRARRIAGGPTRSLERENRWIRAHAREYPGCWIAVVGDRFVAADPELARVMEIVEQDNTVVDPLLHFQPGATG
jgi:hypothetical protein